MRCVWLTWSWLSAKSLTSPVWACSCSRDSVKPTDSPDDCSRRDHTWQQKKKQAVSRVGV